MNSLTEPVKSRVVVCWESKDKTMGIVVNLDSKVKASKDETYVPGDGNANK